MKWIDYREALGVSFSDVDKARMLAGKIRILFVELSGLGPWHEENSSLRYFYVVGEINPTAYYTWNAVEKSILAKKDISELISYTIAFSNALKIELMPKVGNFVLERLQNYLNELKLEYDIFNDEDGYFIFPKGAKELDEANVNIPFEWLRSYPASRNAMENALRAYSNKVAPSQVADLFRKALETFIQEFFNTNASLENTKSIVGLYFKNQNIPKELSNNFETTMQLYTNYMNNYAKHHDNTSERFLEFIMYQTGNIIRFILSLSQDGQTGEKSKVDALN